MTDNKQVRRSKVQAIEFLRLAAEFKFTPTVTAKECKTSEASVLRWVREHGKEAKVAIVEGVIRSTFTAVVEEVTPVASESKEAWYMENLELKRKVELLRTENSELIRQNENLQLINAKPGGRRVPLDAATLEGLEAVGQARIERLQKEIKAVDSALVLLRGEG